MAATALSFLLLTVSLACAEVFVELDSLEVVRGRAEFITNRHLMIKVEPDSNCKVEVVLNEPITQRVGKVTPQVTTAVPLTATRFSTKHRHEQRSFSFLHIIFHVVGFELVIKRFEQDLMGFICSGFSLKMIYLDLNRF